MEWRLTERDWWWFAAMPLAAAALLAWLWTAPLAAAAREARREREALGGEEVLKARIEGARARARAAEASLAATKERLAAEDAAAGDEVLPPAEPPGTLKRLQGVQELCRECGVQVLSSARSDADRSGSLGRAGLPVDAASEYWAFRIRATLEEATALLRAIEAAPSTTLVDSLALAAMPMPGEKLDWTMTLWL